VAAAIQIADLNFSYPPALPGRETPAVLRSISLTVEAGAFVALMGPVGAGKTTLCMALNGLVPQATGGRFDGRVIVNGRDCRQTPAAEIAAGVVLIGSCPGGVASNLMTYLANGDVALSVTMTSCSTLVSPIMTPFLMKVLASQYVPVQFFDMMFSIINMIIVPIVAGLVANRILYSRHEAFNRAASLTVIAVVGIVLAILLALFVETLGGLQKDGLVIGLLLIGAVALAKLIVSVLAKGPENWMDKALPIVSMAGICFIIAIITARSSEKLMTVGIALIGASVLHNTVGYILGYWCARAVRLDERTCRTIAFEVGMQNGGMASGLAMNVLKSANAALAPAIFGPWMNISGSVLATWWHRKPVKASRPPAK